MFFHPLSLNAVWFAMLAWPRGDPKVSVLHFVKREVTPLSLWNKLFYSPYLEGIWFKTPPSLSQWQSILRTPPSDLRKTKSIFPSCEKQFVSVVLITHELLKLHFFVCQLFFWQQEPRILIKLSPLGKQISLFSAWALSFLLISRKKAKWKCTPGIKKHRRFFFVPILLAFWEREP